MLMTKSRRRRLARLSPAIGAGALLTLGLVLVHCAPPRKTGTNLSMSNDEAAVILDLEAKKSDEVKKAIEGIRSALGPLEKILRDIDKLVEVRIDGKAPKDAARRAVNEFISKLREQLDLTRDGIFRMKDRESWSIERKVKISTVREYSEACDALTLRVEGRTRDGVDEAELTLRECEREPRRIASLRIEGGKARFLLDKKGIDGLKPTEALTASAGACTVNVDLKDNATDVFCEPLTFVIFEKLDMAVTIERGVPAFTALTGEIHPIWARQDRGGFSGQVRLNLFNELGLPVAGAEALAEPGQRPRVNLCKDGCWDKK